MILMNITEEILIHGVGLRWFDPCVCLSSILTVGSLVLLRFQIFSTL